MSGPFKNLKTGGIEQKDSDKKIQLLVDQGKQFAKFSKLSIDEL